MHVLILTIGSRGDVQPYVALGAGLLAAGHRVTLATSPRFRDLVEDAGLSLAPVSDELVALADSPLGRGLFEDMGESYWKALWAVWRTLGRIDPIQHDLVADGWKAAQTSRPDLIVYHPKMAGAPHYAEKLGIPAVLALVFPQMVPTGAFPSVGFPETGWGAAYNRLTYRVVLALSGFFARRYAAPWRRAHGLPPDRTDVLHHADGSPIPILHGFSPTVVPPPADWPPAQTTTGYWFLDRADAFAPPDELAAFLAQGDAPVYIGFGSMAARDPERTTRIVLEAVDRAGVRAILATGWGGLRTADVSASVYLLDQAPHDWLFERVAAVVHHGGAGTTAAGLRAGKPTVICPFFGDQPFWGRRVHALGAGPAPIPQKHLTAERLAGALRQATTDAAMQRRASALGEAIHREDGVARAVATLTASRTCD
jgi:sterol 3beta-glucosyltransferase